MMRWGLVFLWVVVASCTDVVHLAIDVPVVQSIEPASNATDVDFAQTIRIVFAEPIRESVLLGTNIRLSSGGTSVSGQVEVDGATLTFQPTERLEYLTSYDVAISGIVDDDSGAMMPEPVSWSFATRDYAWGASTVMSGLGASAGDGHVAIVPDRSALLVWAESNSIFASTRSSSGTWTAAQVVEQGAGLALGPRVAVDRDGNGIATWTQTNGTRYDAWAARFTAPSSWSLATQIEVESAGDAQEPALAMNEAGTAFAVTTILDGTRANLWANRFVSGSNWGLAGMVESDNFAGTMGPDVAIDSSGFAIAVWTQDVGSGDEGVWANRYVPGTGWGTPIQIDALAGECFSPIVAMDGSGNAMVVWQNFVAASTRTDVWANRYVTGGGWQGAQLVETDDVASANAATVAVDLDGRFLVGWAQNDGTRFNAWSRRYVPGSGWETAQLLEHDDSGEASGPYLSLDARGNGVALWQIGPNYDLRVSRYFSNDTWASGSPLEATSGVAFPSDLVLASNGTGVAVWTQNDGTSYRVWVRPFD